MLKVFFKALVVFWPFIKSIIFKDRPVKEVLRANRQFTWLFLILVAVSLTLYVTTQTLSDTQRVLSRNTQTLHQLETELDQKKAAYQELRAKLDSIDLQCVPEVYDKSHLLELLE